MLLAVYLMLACSMPFFCAEGVILKGNNTFHIGGIFNFYDSLLQNRNVNPQFGIMFYEAMRLAVRKINQDPSVLYGFRLSTEIRDGTDGLQQVTDIVNGFATGLMTFAVGPLVNQDAFTLSIVSSSIDYPLVSYYSSFDGVDTSKSRTFFFRTVASDAFRVRAALDLVDRMKWNYVSVISSFDKNGERMAKLFVDNLRSINACLGDLEILTQTPKVHEFDQAVTYISKNSRVQVLVLFTYYKDTREVLRALKRHNLTNRFYIFAPSGLANYFDLIHGNEDVVEGCLSIEFKPYPVKDFEEYFLSLTPSSCNCNPEYQQYFNMFWENTFKCKLPSSFTVKSKLPPCNGKEKLKEGLGYYSSSPVHNVVDAVYALAYALQHFIVMACDNMTLPNNPCVLNRKESFYYVGQMRKKLASLSFRDGTLNLSAPIVKRDASTVEFEIHNLVKRKDRNKASSDYYMNNVGSWTYKRTNLNVTGMEFFETGKTGHLLLYEQTINWGKSRKVKPASKCSYPCRPGEYFVRDRHLGRAICCWDCRPCPKNNIVSNNTCIDCGFMGHPDRFRKTCVNLPQKYLRLKEDAAVQVFVAVSSLGLVAAMLLTALFLKNNDHKVVKAAGRDLCYFLILGIFMTFFTPFLFIIPPSAQTCALRGIFPGLAFCMCYAPLFLKTNRIYRIFHHAQTSVGRPPLVSPQAQVVILFGIFAIQLLLGSIWLVSKPPKANIMVSPSRDYITEQCDNDVFPLSINLSVSVVLMIACTWQAFKTRNFPKNFNEAKYIGFTMYITCIFWAIFIPTYFISKRDPIFIREYLMCSICDLVGLITLVGLFGQKVKLLIMPARVELHGADGHSMTPSFAFKSEKKPMKSVKLGVLNENCEEITGSMRPSISNYSVRSDMSSKS